MANSTSPLTAVIAGVGGTVGMALASALLRDGWTVVGLARRPAELPGLRWLGVDLTDARDCRDKLRSLTAATHLFCTARVAFAEGGREPLDENLAIVRNVVEVLDEHAPELRHIHLVQGSKYYGSHVGPITTPAREHHPRSLVPNFYYTQQDYVAEKQRGARWTWSASRPDALIHATAGVPRNLVAAVAAYALICRELGQPFSFPGGRVAYEALYQCTATDQLAAGILWMAQAPEAANQAYNLVNGDYFRWVNLWPVFAEHFGVPLGPVRKFSLSEAMADKGAVWDRIVRRHGLRPYPMERVAHWPYAEYIWAREWDVMSDMTKARLHGFHRTVDTEAEFIRLFDQLRAAGVIPESSHACKAASSRKTKPMVVPPS
jgi:nucleoside-diphosphate-sugar epimerase